MKLNIITVICANNDLRTALLIDGISRFHELSNGNTMVILVENKQLEIKETFDSFRTRLLS